MFGIATDTDTQSADRLLKIRSVLRRLRPLKLATVVRELQDTAYTCQALRLMRTHFPDKAHYDAAKLPGWDDIYSDFCRSVEAAGWFELDWENTLDPDYQAVMEGEDNLDTFAQWLYEIPVLCFGFSDYDDMWPEQYPALALLKSLLMDFSGRMQLLEHLVDEYDLNLNPLDNLYHSDLWEHLGSGNFAGYDKPLCWLPDVALIVCGRTGNLILDSANYLEEEPLGWTWADDLETAKTTYAAAKPAIQHWREFTQWCTAPEDMQAVIDALAKPKRKRARRSKRKTLVELLTPSTERDL